MIKKFDSSAPLEKRNALLKEVDEKEQLLDSLPQVCSSDGKKEIKIMRTNLNADEVDFCEDLVQQRLKIKKLTVNGTGIMTDFSTNLADVVIQLIDCPLRSTFLKLGCVLKVALKIAHKFPDVGKAGGVWLDDVVDTAYKTIDDISGCYSKQHSVQLLTQLKNIEKTALDCREKYKFLGNPEH